MSRPHPTPVNLPRQRRTVVMLIHGFLSGPQAFLPFLTLLDGDPELNHVVIAPAFKYHSPGINLRRGWAIPDVQSIALQLKGYIEEHTTEHDDVVLLAHSQGCLVVMQYLADALHGERGKDLKRIRRIGLYAPPLLGSDRLMSLRRPLSFVQRNVQEIGLRRGNATMRATVNDAVRATRSSTKKRRVTAHHCDIDIRVYLATADKTVMAESVLHADLPSIGLNANHSSVIRPTSRNDACYRAMRRDIVTVSGVSSVSEGQVPVGRDLSEYAPEKSAPWRKRAALAAAALGLALAAFISFLAHDQHPAQLTEKQRPKQTSPTPSSSPPATGASPTTASSPTPQPTPATTPAGPALASSPTPRDGQPHTLAAVKTTGATAAPASAATVFAEDAPAPAQPTPCIQTYTVTDIPAAATRVTTTFTWNCPPPQGTVSEVIVQTDNGPDYYNWGTITETPQTFALTFDTPNVQRHICVVNVPVGTVNTLTPVSSKGAVRDYEGAAAAAAFSCTGATGSQVVSRVQANYYTS